jgi:2TM domain
MPDEPTSKNKPEVIDETDEKQVREQAIRQIEQERRFHKHAVEYVVVSILLTIVWAISEYNNANGWPTSGFSESSGTQHVWNLWIVYPVVVLGALLTIEAWNTYRRKPITEREVKHQMDRLRGAH